MASILLIRGESLNLYFEKENKIMNETTKTFLNEHKEGAKNVAVVFGYQALAVGMCFVGSCIWNAISSALSKH